MQIRCLRVRASESSSAEGKDEIFTLLLLKSIVKVFCVNRNLMFYFVYSKSALNDKNQA